MPPHGATPLPLTANYRTTQGVQPGARAGRAALPAGGRGPGHHRHLQRRRGRGHPALRGIEGQGPLLPAQTGGRLPGLRRGGALPYHARRSSCAAKRLSDAVRHEARCVICGEEQPAWCSHALSPARGRQQPAGCSRVLSPACAGSSLRGARVRSALPAVQPWRQVLAAAGGHVCGCQRDHCAAATALVGALGCGLVWCSMPSLAQPPTHLLQFEGGPGLPEAGVMVCGDSGNDVELFAVPGAAGAGTARSLPVCCATGWASTGSALAQPPSFNLPPREGRSNPPDRGSSAQGALHARPRLLPAFLPPLCCRCARLHGGQRAQGAARLVRGPQERPHLRSHPGRPRRHRRGAAPLQARPAQPTGVWLARLLPQRHICGHLLGLLFPTWARSWALHGLGHGPGRCCVSALHRLLLLAAVCEARSPACCPPPERLQRGGTYDADQARCIMAHLKPWLPTLATVVSPHGSGPLPPAAFPTLPRPTLCTGGRPSAPSRPGPRAGATAACRRTTPHARHTFWWVGLGAPH